MEILLEAALKQRQSDLMAQRNALLEKVQKMENARYDRMFSDNPVVDGKEEIALGRRQLDVMAGQITEVKFWLFEMLPTVG